jgi:formylglycine-generating enzyme required for sulfatase activity
VDPFAEKTIPTHTPRYYQGRRIFTGRFTLVKPLGKGNMGVVWLAHDNELGVHRALKFSPPEIAADARSVAMLKREVLNGTSLAHANIVRIFDFAHDPAEGESAVVMEAIEGKTLAELQAERIETSGHGFFEPAEVEPLLRDIAAALDYAHGERRVHRDLKPQNLMRETSTGRIKIMDFGISRRIDDSLTQLTSRDSSGTLPYMSPQQVIGETTIASDDIYGLGATLYDLLSGSPPFTGGALESQIKESTPVSLTAKRQETWNISGQPVPAAWEAIVLQCLAKQPAQRPATAGDIPQALADAGRNAPETAVGNCHSASSAQAISTQPPLSSPVRSIAAKQTVRRATSRSKTPFIPAVLLACGGLAYWGLHQAVPESAERPKAIIKASLDSEPLPRATASLDSGTIGQTYTTTLLGSVELKLCYCPPGTFTMGSPESEKDRSENEKQVEVTLTQPFWLAETEFTQEQWKAVMGGENLSVFEGDELPVDSVDWEKVQACIAALNVKAKLPDGWEWALPTEAQWEYACRAGTPTVFSFGSSLSSHQANFEFEGNKLDGYAAESVYRKKTTKVRSYAPNPWGLYDMHGNVWEWCKDWFEETLQGGANPTGPASGSAHVVRGGSWLHGAGFCRAAFRIEGNPDWDWDDLGFRLAAVPAGR